MAALHAAANQQTMVRAIECHSMGLRTARYGPGGKNLALFAVNDDHIAGVACDDVHLRRIRVQGQTGGVQSLPPPVAYRFPPFSFDHFTNAPSPLLLWALRC